MSEELRTVPCSGHQKGGKCRTPLLWGKTADEKKIPLDTKAVVYEIIGEFPDGTPMLQRATGVYVTHFATCADRDMFSAGKKKSPP